MLDGINPIRISSFFVSHSFSFDVKISTGIYDGDKPNGVCPWKLFARRVLAHLTGPEGITATGGPEA